MSNRHREFTEAIDFPSREFAEIAIGSEASVLLLAARHADGLQVGQQRISDLRDYTLYDLPLAASSTLVAVWNLGFTAGAAYIEGVTPADAEATDFTEDDILQAFADVGVQVQFADADDLVDEVLRVVDDAQPIYDDEEPF